MFAYFIVLRVEFVEINFYNLTRCSVTLPRFGILFCLYVVTRSLRVSVLHRYALLAYISCTIYIVQSLRCSTSDSLRSTLVLLHDGSGTLGTAQVITLSLRPCGFVLAIEVISQASNVVLVLIWHSRKNIINKVIALNTVSVVVTLGEVVLTFVHAVLLA